MILLIFSTFLSTWNVEVRAIVKDLDQVNNADSAFTFFFLSVKWSEWPKILENVWMLWSKTSWVGNEAILGMRQVKEHSPMQFSWRKSQERQSIVNQIRENSNSEIGTKDKEWLRTPWLV